MTLPENASRRIPRARVFALAAKAAVDPRTIVSVLADPATAARNGSRMRAADVLRAEGLLPSAPSSEHAA